MRYNLTVFQFQHGTIKALVQKMVLNVVKEFQFQHGTIKA